MSFFMVCQSVCFVCFRNFGPRGRISKRVVEGGEGLVMFGVDEVHVSLLDFGFRKPFIPLFENAFIFYFIEINFTI